MGNRFSSPGMGTHGSSWQVGGYSGCGNVEELLGSLRGRPAVVCGNAWTVFTELEVLRAMYGLDLVVYGVNDVGMFLSRMDHWVSLHHNQFEQWKPVRWMHHRGDEWAKYHGISKEHFLVDYAWELLTPTMALSGYFAMQIAWLMGCSPIVLAGCPGDSTRRFFEHAGRSDFGYGSGSSGSDDGIRQQLINEMDRVPDFKLAVRSMSGWTRDYFGGV